MFSNPVDFFFVLLIFSIYANSALFSFQQPVNMLEGTLAGGPSMQEWVQNAAHSNTLTGNECSICYERSIDSVLYMCGHMCMCYECAVQQWRGKGGGQCPMCRAPIRDVIRTYKS